MEMVRNMPEACYELSLKDLVEKPVLDQSQAQAQAQARHEEKDDVNIRRNNSQKKRSDFGNKGKEMRRSGTMENEGFLLKMVFPVSFGSNKKKRQMMMMKKNENQSNSILANTTSKVSPTRPSVSDGSKGSSGSNVDKEWWNKRFSVSGESESGDHSSLNSGSMKSSSGSTNSSSSRSSSTRYVNKSKF